MANLLNTLKEIFFWNLMCKTILPNDFIILYISYKLIWFKLHGATEKIYKYTRIITSRRGLVCSVSAY